MKLYVYAICRDEAKFAARWMASMSEADGVYVLDTGSADGSPERLEQLGAHVFRRAIQPWRFDDARNLSLELTPEDGDLYICTDLDEIFDPGWRQALERAAAENDWVHLFVLSEDVSLFPFAVRKKLVAEGTAHLSNVVLHDSGPYIISAATFPSYFLKDEDKIIRTHAALDLALFSSIAQSLGITRRYVGEEPASHVTSLYNAIMARELPARGVDCVILPRFETAGVPVSASTLRKAIQAGDWDAVRPLVPETTWAYLRSPAAGPVLEAIRTAGEVVHY